VLGVLEPCLGDEGDGDLVEEGREEEMWCFFSSFFFFFCGGKLRLSLISKSDESWRVGMKLKKKNVNFKYK
jgi:hypothetical protein